MFHPPAGAAQLSRPAHRERLNRLFDFHRQGVVQQAMSARTQEIRVVSPQFGRLFIAQAESSFGITPKDATARHWLKALADKI